MAARKPTEPGVVSPELNALRIDQVQQDIEQVRSHANKTSSKLEKLTLECNTETEKVRQLKESRDKLGKRLGDAENIIADLKGWKKLLLFIGAVGSLGIGALLKSIFDVLLKGN